MAEGICSAKCACCEANGTSIVQSPSTFLKHARPSLLPSGLYVPVEDA